MDEVAGLDGGVEAGLPQLYLNNGHQARRLDV
jgi:hypothetical protein